MALDKLDQILIEQLKDDARQPILALAQKLGVNRETVRYRVNRLISEGIIQITCACNIELLGYHFVALMGIKARPGGINTVTNKLVTLKAVKHVCQATGRYNILAWPVLRDSSDFTHLVSEDLAQISDHIASIEIMQSYHWVKDWWRLLVSPTQKSPVYPSKNLNDLDLYIIRALQLNPRETITQLAKTLNCSRSVVKNQFERLISGGIIRFVPIVNPTLPGEGKGAVILIKCELDKLHTLANELSAQDLVMHVSFITGQWQLLVVTQFQDSDQLYKLTSEALNSGSGAIEVEVVTLGKTEKFSSTVLD